VSENLRKLIGVAVMAAIVVVGVVATNDDDSDFDRTRNVAFGLPKGAGLDAQVQQPGDAELDLTQAMKAAAKCEEGHVLISTGDPVSPWRCGPLLNSLLDRIASVENGVTRLGNAGENAPANLFERQEAVERLLRDAGCDDSRVVWFCSSTNGVEGLSGADLSNANLAGSVWSGVRLRGVTFSGSNLVGASFTQTDLTAADFTNADLTAAEMDGGLTVFGGADFAGANLANARIGVTSVGAIGLPQATPCTFDERGRPLPYPDCVRAGD